ncbi:MAG: hypothetical protein WD200_05330 [Candidatus Andersenbacteria bacterium]
MSFFDKLVAWGCIPLFLALCVYYAASGQWWLFLKTIIWVGCISMMVLILALHHRQLLRRSKDKTRELLEEEQEDS